MGAVLECSAMIDSFIARATTVSAQVERAANRELALEMVLRILQNEGVDNKPGSGAVWAKCPMVRPIDETKLESSVRGLSFNVTRELAADAKAGISQMDWALANTGTLVQTADESDKRLVSTLPPLHIALISAAQMVPDLPTLLTKIDPRKSAYLAFITGPSRTADIERVLTIGVHGPERLIIILVEEAEVGA